MRSKVEAIKISQQSGRVFSWGFFGHLLVIEVIKKGERKEREVNEEEEEGKGD